MAFWVGSGCAAPGLCKGVCGVSSAAWCCSSCSGLVLGRAMTSVVC